MAAHICEKRLANTIWLSRRQIWSFTKKKEPTPSEIEISALDSENPIPQTGIPLIIAPHVIRRAFIVHPSTKTFQASAKYQWLTKTKLFEGLPPSLPRPDSFLFEDDYSSLKEEFKCSLLQNYGFRKEGVRRGTFERRGEELRMGVLQELLKFCWSLADRFPHLNDVFLDHKPKIKIHWVRHHNFYQMEHKPAYIIRTKQPTPLFEQDVERTKCEVLPGPYDNYSLNVYRHPIVHLRNIPGYQNSAWNKYRYNHTMLVTNTNNMTHEQQQAYGMMAMFSASLALALDRGVKMGEHLSDPVATKCVITDGIQFTLMCYQLNTLSFQEDFGIKNSAWASKSMDLFTRQETANSRRIKPVLYETLPDGVEVPGFNDECFKTLLSFLCQETE